MIEKKAKFDLGSKNVKKTFFTILIPTLIAQVIAGTFVIFDTFFVSHGFQPFSVFGNGVGDLSVYSSSYASLGPAAISYAMPYTFFIIGIGLAIGGGLSSIMTKQMANNDITGQQKTMNSFLPISIISGFILMIFLLIAAKFLVWLGSGFQKDYLNAWFSNPLMDKNWEVDPENLNTLTYKYINGHILSQAAWYLRIQAIGVIPYIYMSAGVIMLRVQGKAHYATSFSVVGLITNIILDFVLIMVLKMNVVGAAIATIIGQFATAAIYWYYFTFKANIRSNKMEWKYSISISKETFVSGVSIMMLQVLTGLTLLIFTFSIGVTNFGEMYAVTNYTAVYQGYNALFIFCNLIIIAAAQSMKPIVEYNYVKNDYENVRKARNWGFGFGFIFALIVTIMIVIFRKEIIGLFYTVKGGLDFISTGYFMQNPPIEGIVGNVYTDGMNVAGLITGVLFLSFPIAACIQLTGTYIQGLGENNRTSILLFGKLILLVPLVFILGFGFSNLLQSNWDFFTVDDLGNKIEILNDYEQANLGMFLALPITDFIICFIMIYFLTDSEFKLRKTQKAN